MYQAQLLKKINKLILGFSFFMAFPVILILGQNISIFFFLVLTFLLLKSTSSLHIKLRKAPQWLALAFGIAALTSVINIPLDHTNSGLQKATSVLPNYLYWCYLIVFLTSFRAYLNLNIISNGIFWGIISTLLYYLFLQRFLNPLPIFNRLSANSFSFILICYSPIAINYAKAKYGNSAAFIMLIVLILTLLTDGRRAGMALVLFGGLATLYGAKINARFILKISLFVPFFILSLKSNFVEGFIYKSSERIHQMIYETEKIGKEDRSYLTRVAMVEKGLAIFKKHPYTGIGLNNFANYSIRFDKSFEGARFVVHKRGIQQRSAHNSYVSILAEGGIILFLPFVFLLALLLQFFIFNFSSIPDFYKPFYWGLICMAIHLYFISAIVNVFAWYLIGICCALKYKK